MHSWRVIHVSLNVELIHESINGPHWPPLHNPGALSDVLFKILQAAVNRYLTCVIKWTLRAFHWEGEELLLQHSS